MKITQIETFIVDAGWRPWIFVKIETDEGVTGWGEITTTTKIANRALCAILSRIGEMIAGENPAHIERLWHKIFRSFTYMGSRGAAVECVSAIDIALWDIRGKVLGKPIYELLGGAVRDEVALYTHPDQRKFTTKEGVVNEIRDIVKSGHTALKFDPYEYQGEVIDGRAREQRNGYLDGSMTRKHEREAAELTALIRETAGPETEILIDAHGRFDVPTAIRLCRSLANCPLERFALCHVHVRRQERSEQFARLANGIGLADMPEVRRAFVQIIGFRLPATNPADLVERGERRSRRGWVSRLAVVDEEHAVTLADALHAVREAGIGA